MRALYILMIAALVPACSSDDSSNTPDASDAATQSDVNVSETNTTYPAFAPDVPQVVSAGGPVLNTPKVQPVFFPGFDYPTQLTSFLATVGATTYWGVLSEYKVGALTSATPVTLTSSQIVPADIGNITDAYIQSWLQSRFDGTHPEFGTTPDASTVYALFYPSATVISLGGGGGPTDAGVPDGGGFGSQKSCQSFGGYHGDVGINGVTVAYAVLPECPSFGALNGVDALTATTSHELAEAATDPFPTSNPAYSQVDTNHFAWMSFLGGGEIGDMCAQFPTSFYVPPNFGFMVQRPWSNASAKAGTDPCQIADATPYFNAMPVFNDTVATRGGGTSKGVVVPVNGSKALELDLFSDKATSGPWTLTAQAYGRGGAAVPISFAFDNTTGQNGDKVNLTITSSGALTNTTKTATFVVRSTLNARENVWIGYIGQ